MLLFQTPLIVSPIQIFNTSFIWWYKFVFMLHKINVI